MVGKEREGDLSLSKSKFINTVKTNKKNNRNTAFIESAESNF